MIFYIGILFTLCVAISTAISISIQRNLLVKMSKKDFRILTEAIERSLSHAMILGRSDEVQAIINYIGEHEEIVKLRIFSPDGVILRSADEGEIGKKVEGWAIEQFRSGKYCCLLRKIGNIKICSMLRVIKNEKACYRCHSSDQKVLGILQVGMDVEDVEKGIEYITISSILSSFITLLVMAFLGIILQKRLVYLPLKKLENTMEKVKEGNLDVRVDVKTDDEIGRLSSTFNIMLEKLRESKKASERLATIGEFAAGIVHEIKNPLAGISGAIQVISSQLEEGDPRKEIMEEILKEIDSLEALAKDILAYARPSEPQKQEVSIIDVVEDSLRFIDPHYFENIKIEKDYGDVPKVKVDPNQMRQVFQNIILNGLQAMKEGGRLKISVGKDNGFVKVSVEDEGIGIPKEDLDKIFKPFYSTKESGSGLGLPIVQRIVEKHGGKIDVESEVGKGTKFTIYIPIENGRGKDTSS